jgi:hypothetical protein
MHLACTFRHVTSSYTVFREVEYWINPIGRRVSSSPLIPLEENHELA